MAGPIARTMILRLFQQGAPRDPEEPISFATILEALSSQYSKGTISARLSELVDEGILERSGRGDYRLVYTQASIPPRLVDLVDLLADQLPERTLHGTVVWDATPVLADTEDGVMASIQVLETERFTGGSTARMLLDHWTGEEVPHVEEFPDRDALLDEVIAGGPTNAPVGKPRVLVGPAEGLYAGTMLRPEGIRLASPERILADLLWLDDATAGDIARTRLTAPSADIDPAHLFAAADERNILPDLFAVLSSLRDRLPTELGRAYNERLHGAARAATDGTRV